MINTRELVGAALCVPQHYIFPRGRKSQKKPQLLESEDTVQRSKSQHIDFSTSVLNVKKYTIRTAIIAIVRWSIFGLKKNALKKSIFRGGRK